MKKSIVIVMSIVAVVIICVTILFLVLMPKYPQKYKAEIAAASDAYQLEQSLVFAVCYAESGFNKNALSKSGACGLMQIMPQTAEWIGAELEKTEYDLFDPKTNIEFGCFYLHYLFEKFKDETSVLAAYNAGESNVMLWQKGKANLEETDIEFLETRNYVAKVQKAKAWYEKHYWVK